jgi:antitoxin (DNA-binding transcriptional repressor) of toxin-antitoxin stability system
MIEDMEQVRMTEAEVTNDFGAVLEKLRQGAEIVVEQDHRPVAIIRPPKRSGRPISECIASAKASGSKVTLDGGFAADVEEGIRSRQQPWNPPSWDLSSIPASSSSRRRADRDAGKGLDQLITKGW